MLKQWSLPVFKIYYVFLPNEKDTILTSDGVKININTLNNMTPTEYDNLKKVESFYDYNKSKIMGKLVLKEPTVKKVKVAKGTKEESKPKVKPKRKRNLESWIFEKFGKYLMLGVSIGTGILSIYYTSQYLYRLDNPLIIAILLSSTMYIFGLFGINFAYTFKKQKNKVLSCLFFIASLTTIFASILSSADVNMTNYLEKLAQNQQIAKQDKGQEIKVDLIQNEIKSNNSQIDVLRKDIEIQSQNYVRAWSNSKNDFEIIVGKLTAEAQTQIDKDKTEIARLQDRNFELNNDLLLLAENGVSFSDSDNIKISNSLSDVLGGLLGIKSEYVHLIILLFYSCFIDIVSVLGMTAFYRLH